MILAAMPEIRNSFIAPASVALRIRDDILFSGEVSYGYIGVEIDENATKNLGRHLVISKALPNSPCAEAGVKPGDTLIHFNGTEINRLSDLNHAVFFARPGQCLTLTVLREGKEYKLPVHVTKKLPEEFDINTKKSEEPAQQTTIASSKSN